MGVDEMVVDKVGINTVSNRYKSEQFIFKNHFI